MRPYFDMISVIFLLVLQVSASNFLQAQDVAADSASAATVSGDEVRQLIARLESAVYRERQQATRQLTGLGVTVVSQLVEQIVQGRPESAFRCTEVLSRIALENDQADMTRIARILLLLSENGFDHLRDESLTLNNRWKRSQVERNLSRIRSAGIEVQEISAMDPFGGGDPFGAPAMLQIVDLQNGQTPGSETPSPGTSRPETTPRVAPDELMKRAEQILDESDQVNESRFEAEMVTEKAPRSPAAGTRGIRPGVALIERGGVIAIRGEGLIVNGAPVAGSAFSVAIGPEFSGTAEDLKLLGLLPVVNQLTIRNRRLDADFLQTIRSIPPIGTLSLETCDYELVAMLDVLHARPEMHVTASGHKSFLGVLTQNAAVLEGREGEYHCVIDSVVENTAAARAGCLAGDVIQKMNGVPIANYSQLVVAIGSFDPGDQATLEIRRDDQVMELTVTFMDRPPDQ